MITLQQLEALRRYDSPTICNAVEYFNIRPRTQGYLSYKIKSQFPCERPLIGYAATAKFTAKAPATPKEPAIPIIDYYRYLQNVPRPSIAVFQDVDYPDCASAVCGEVMALIQQALGCDGLVTNGGVRDMKEVRAMNFAYFATDVMVSHAYLHLIDYNCPVELLGTIVRPNDLLFCDDQGIVIIPEDIVPDIPKACADVAGIEVPTITLCKEAILGGKELDCDRLEKELNTWLTHIGA